MAVNADSRSAFVPFELGIGSGYNLMTGEQTSFHGGAELPPRFLHLLEIGLSWRGGVSH